MKNIVKYEISDWANYALHTGGVFLSLACFLVLKLFVDFASPAGAALFGGFAAIAGYELLLLVYIKLTKQYNSFGEWVAGGEGKPDKISSLQRKERRELRWSILLLAAGTVIYFLYKFW